MRDNLSSRKNLYSEFDYEFEYFTFTGRMGWMANRKWKEIKLQPSMLPGPAVPGSCIASFHFRWAIHPIRPVLVLYLFAYSRQNLNILSILFAV